jgi:dsDNA-binding SOS-regulon protein
MDNPTPKRKATPTSGAGNGQGRKPKWKHTQTTAIRVPKHIIAPLLEIARYLDNLDDFVQKPEKLKTTLVTIKNLSTGQTERTVVSLTESDRERADELADKLQQLLSDSGLSKREQQEVALYLLTLEFKSNLTQGYLRII